MQSFVWSLNLVLSWLVCDIYDTLVLGDSISAPSCLGCQVSNTNSWHYAYDLAIFFWPTAGLPTQKIPAPPLKLHLHFVKVMQRKLWPFFPDMV